MILLDTNVVSELMKPDPNSQVLAWFARIDGNDLFTSTVTEAEVRAGLAVMPEGRRRDALLAEANAMFENVLSEQILSFDRIAAHHCANVMARRRAEGRPVQTADAMIVAIAIAHGFAVATRDVRDFADTGVTVLNPFDGAL
ncbi:MAG: type II toxin-antitoxin system VapC family toxin [Hyphomicrobiaceae bacterium]